MKKDIKRCFLLGIVAMFLLGVDLGTKYLFYNQEVGIDLSFLEPVFNTGISWGVGLPHVIIFVVAGFSLGLFVWMYIKKYFSRWVLALLLAGTLGNLLDRILLGGVRDFLMIGNFPVFNVADVMLNVGVGVFVLLEVRRGLKGRVKSE